MLWRTLTEKMNIFNDPICDLLRCCIFFSQDELIQTIFSKKFIIRILCASIIPSVYITKRSPI